MNPVLRHLRARQNREWLRHAQDEARRLFPGAGIVRADRSDVILIDATAPRDGLVVKLPAVN